MYLKIKFVSFVCLASIAVAAAVNPDPKKSNITIYYQTYCPRSVKLITEQVYPAFKANAFSDLAIVLAPVSNLVTAENGTMVFNCSHGPNECYGNRIHVCVLGTNESMEKKMKFINCTMSRSPGQAEFPTEACAKEAEISITGFEACATSAATNDTLREYFRDYQSTNGSIPATVFNGIFDENTSNAAVNDLQKTLCGMENFRNHTKNWCDSKPNNSASMATITVLPAFILGLIIAKLYE